jgi:hypothetical protein
MAIGEEEEDEEEEEEDEEEEEEEEEDEEEEEEEEDRMPLGACEVAARATEATLETAADAAAAGTSISLRLRHDMMKTSRGQGPTRRSVSSTKGSEK